MEPERVLREGRCRKTFPLNLSITMFYSELTQTPPDSYGNAVTASFHAGRVQALPA
jgi:hypothetical protein